jgi:hypothetical protein
MAVDRIGDGLALRSKGDIVSYDGTANIAINVGTDGQVLQAQSSTASGITWGALPGGDTQQYIRISGDTNGGTPTSVTISSIPSTYKHLRLIISANLNSSSQEIFIRFNSDTASNYAWGETKGTNGTATWNGGSSDSVMYTGGGKLFASFEHSYIIMDLYHYANTNFYKTAFFSSDESVTNSAGGGGEINKNVGIWKSTSAVSSITFLVTSDSFDSYSYALYGVND